MQVGYHAVWTIAIVEAVSALTGNVLRGVVTLFAAFFGVLFDGPDHLIDKFVGKKQESWFFFGEVALTPEEAAEKAKYHIPHYILFGAIFFYCVWRWGIGYINQLGVEHSWDWLFINDFWLLWASVIPYSVHILSDVSLLTHSSDCMLWPFNYLLRWFGVHFPLGIIPNGSQGEAKITYFINTGIMTLYSLFSFSGFVKPILLLVCFCLAGSGIKTLVKKEKMHPMLSPLVGVASLFYMILARWPVF